MGGGGRHVTQAHQSDTSTSQPPLQVGAGGRHVIQAHQSDTSISQPPLQVGGGAVVVADM